MNIIIRNLSLISKKTCNSFSNRTYGSFGNFIFPNAGNNLFAVSTPVMRMDKSSGNYFLNNNILLNMLIRMFADRKIGVTTDRTFFKRNGNILVNSLGCFSACSRMAERRTSFLWDITRRISFGIKLFKRSLLSLGEVFFKRFLSIN